MLEVSKIVKIYVLKYHSDSIFRYKIISKKGATRAAKCFVGRYYVFHFCAKTNLFIYSIIIGNNLQ